MPTFQSVSLDATVQSFLAGNSTEKVSQASKGHDGNNVSNATARGTIANNRQQKSRSAGTIAGITTPRAMLTRSPEDMINLVLLHNQKDLAVSSHKNENNDDVGSIGNHSDKEPQSRKRDRPESFDNANRYSIDYEQERRDLLEQIELIRSHVATKMIQNRTKWPNATNTTLSLDDTGKTGLHGNALVPYSSTSLIDAWKHRLNRPDGGIVVENPTVIASGCEPIDQLLTFPWETENVSSFTNPKVGRRLGLPLGSVLQISETSLGVNSTSGKTQLAIQLVARTIANSLRTSTDATTTHSPIKVRYCFSASGHSPHGLARRFFGLMEAMEPTQKSHRRNRKKSRVIPPGGDQIEFQRISQLSQLAMTIAELEHSLVCGKIPRNSTGAIAGPPSIIVVDDLHAIPYEQDETQLIAIERSLKRLARQHNVGVIVVGRSLKARDNTMGIADCHLHLSSELSTSLKMATTSDSTLNVQLMRHPMKLVTDKDYASLINSKYGLKARNNDLD